ncbi:lipid A deacylase LpxR family protein [Betaproteobacteria bacterium SCN2]|nr:lipid A deacylase LpxR family protein [Betaproteobacteria bacterium SCN2]
MPSRTSRPDRRLAGALLLLAATAAQAADLGGSYTLLVENDVFTGSDQHYTNGLRLSYLSRQDDVPDYIRAFAAAMPFVELGARLRAGYALGHNIYTPNNTKARGLVADERPYAGYLYAGMAVVAESDSRSGNILDTWELDIGIVGPSALGKEVQNNFHRLIGSPQAQGWENQLEDEPVVSLTHERKWRHLWRHPAYGLGLDFTPHVGGSLGNLATYLNLGATVRVGQGLARDYGPPRIRPSLPGSGFFLPQDGMGWYVYAGVDGRAMAHNIFLDGNTFKDSHSVDSKTWVGDLQMGLVLTFSTLRLAYTHIYRTREFEGQKLGDSFGAVSISARF